MPPLLKNSRVLACSTVLAVFSVTPPRTMPVAAARSATAVPRASTAPAHIHEAPALPTGAGADWWTAVRAYIEEEVYAVRPDMETAPGRYDADNPVQRWHARFTPNGVEVTPVATAKGQGLAPGGRVRYANPDTEHGVGWSVGLRLAAYGAGGVLSPVPPVQPRADGRRVEFRYGQAGGGTPALTEWYENEARGLEHGFTMTAPLGEEGTLTLELAVEGGLRPVLLPDGGAVELCATDGTALVRYADLSVIDASGRRLPSRMGVKSGEPGRIQLVMDTRGATYPVTVDPLLTEPPTVLAGEATDRYLGYSVATAGDVNGDGYADVVVGAWGYSNSTGRVYLYLGGTHGLAPTPAAVLTGEAMYSYFGVSVASAGDVNGDGYADVVVGARSYGDGVGRAYVYLGGASGLATTAAATLTGEAVSNYFGGSVALAGDVNGDGYADVVIGAPYYGSGTGRAYVYLGGAGGLAYTPAAILTGESGTVRHFGASVASAGDVNGDGYADVVVGSPWSYGGRADVYLGGASGLAATSAATLTAEAAGDYFGDSVSTAGDVNGDGYADVVIGAWGYGGQAGRAYVYLGGAGGLAKTPASVLASDSGGGKFGLSVATAGDVNGDGYADVVVGAPDYENYTGRAYLHLGGASGLAVSPAIVLVGEAPSDQFGFSVASAGDVNGDGRADIVVGAKGYGGSTGRAYAYLSAARVAGDFTGDSKSDILWRRTTGGELWLWPMNGGQHTAESYVGMVDEPAWQIRGLGDQNGDGTADILWRHATTGQLYLWTMNGSTVEAMTYVATVDLAFDIVGTGDYGGDGKSDILWRHQTTGELWLWEMNGPTSVSETYVDTVELSYAIEGSGDLNADGKADLVWQGATGDVWVWLMNGPEPSQVAYVTTVGDLGYRIAGVADYTGDGRADLLWYHAARGEMWLWAMNGVAKVSEAYVGTVPDVNYRIAGNGDHDGDGKADIVWWHATRGEVWVWLMDGAVKVSEHYIGTVPDTGYQIVKAK